MNSENQGNVYCKKPISGLYQILNLYEDKEGNRKWHIRGEVSQKNQVVLDHVRWLGNSYVAPQFTTVARRRLKIAIAAIEPFLILKRPGADNRVCWFEGSVA